MAADARQKQADREQKHTHVNHRTCDPRIDERQLYLARAVWGPSGVLAAPPQNVGRWQPDTEELQMFYGLTRGRLQRPSAVGLAELLPHSAPLHQLVAASHFATISWCSISLRQMLVVMKKAEHQPSGGLRILTRTPNLWKHQTLPATPSWGHVMRLPNTSKFKLNILLLVQWCYAGERLKSNINRGPWTDQGSVGSSSV